MSQAGWMGLLQGLALPFRGFSRSGVTISGGKLTGVAKRNGRNASVCHAGGAITPLAIGREAIRPLRAVHGAGWNVYGTDLDLHATGMISLLGAVFAFLAGLVALKLLSNWLEHGRWYLLGIYCMVAKRERCSFGCTRRH